MQKVHTRIKKNFMPLFYSRGFEEHLSLSCLFFTHYIWIQMESTLDRIRIKLTDLKKNVAGRIQKIQDLLYESGSRKFIQIPQIGIRGTKTSLFLIIIAIFTKHPTFLPYLQKSSTIFTIFTKIINHFYHIY